MDNTPVTWKKKSIEKVNKHMNMNTIKCGQKVDQSRNK
jgi:hypothetical protein